MNHRITIISLCLLALTTINTGCGENSAPAPTQTTNKLEGVKNETVLESFAQLDNDSAKEDVITDIETKKKAEELSEQRKEKLTKKANESPYKGFSDEEIKAKLNERLRQYEENCDSSLFSQIKTEMAYDVVLSVFKDRHADFCSSFHKSVVHAKRNCP